MHNQNKKGIVNIRGKEYQTVPLRIKQFREKYPIESGWGISTEIVKEDDKSVLMCCSIYRTMDSVKGNEFYRGKEVVATGMAEEKKGSSNINKSSLYENCETSAIGRALAACGFVGESISVSTAEEVQSAIGKQKVQPETKADPVIRENPWLREKVGYLATGDLTWDDLCRDKELPGGTKGKEFLIRMKDWKECPQHLQSKLSTCLILCTSEQQRQDIRDKIKRDKQEEQNNDTKKEGGSDDPWDKPPF